MEITKDNYVQNVVQKITQCKDKENFLQEMKKQEEIYYSQFEKQYLDQLRPELQLKEQNPNQIQKEHFLNQRQPTDKDFYSTFERINRLNLDNSTQNPLMQPQRKNIGIRDSSPVYVQPNKNFLDVEANSKFFVPGNQRQVGFKDTNYPSQDFANVANLYQNYQKPQGFQNPKEKEIYPRQVYGSSNSKDNLLQTQQVPLMKPQLPNNFQQNRGVQEQILQLGGIEDCLQVMTPLLNSHEIPNYQRQNIGLGGGFPDDPFMKSQGNGFQNLGPSTINQQLLSQYDPLKKNPQIRGQTENMIRRDSYENLNNFNNVQNQFDPFKKQQMNPQFEQNFDLFLKPQQLFQQQNLIQQQQLQQQPQIQHMQQQFMPNPQQLQRQRTPDMYMQQQSQQQGFGRNIQNPNQQQFNQNFNQPAGFGLNNINNPFN